MIPPAMQEQFGYPPLTPKVKARILGLNAARLYNIDVEAKKKALASSPFSIAAE